MAGASAGWGSARSRSCSPSWRSLLLRNRPAEVGLRPVGAPSERRPPRAPCRSSALRWGAVYRSAHVWHLGGVYTAFGFSYIIYMTFFVKALIAEGGYTPAGGRAAVHAHGLVQPAVRADLGHVSDVIGRKWALVIVYLIQTAAFGLFALWPHAGGLHDLGGALRADRMEHPGHRGRRLRRHARPAHGARGAGLHHPLLRHRPGCRPDRGRRHRGRAGSFSPALLLAAGVALLGALGASLLRLEEHTS